jgi:hypothetical protein
MIRFIALLIAFIWIGAEGRDFALHLGAAILPVVVIAIGLSKVRL